MSGAPSPPAPEPAPAPAPAISAIIPCWNDAAALRGALERFAACPRPPEEIIVADASDNREAADIAAAFGAMVIRCAQPGRGGQLNAGAARASSPVLLFHHADVALGQPHLDALRAALQSDPDLAGGAFFKDTAAHYPRAAWAEPVIRWYSKNIGILYGDQSVFARRRTFESLGGFADIPLMEDVDFSRRLRRAGRITLLDPPLRASMRRFAKRGLLRTKAQNIAFVALFRLGVSPVRLHRWYYRVRAW
ncbi:MAG: TIGR04283 family arsenosugar biosynthesis glycosyltransferase [Verrucomicrobiales bacterium]